MIQTELIKLERDNSSTRPRNRSLLP